MAATSTARNRPYTPPANRSGFGFGLFVIVALAVIIGLILWSLFDGDDDAGTARAGGITEVEAIIENPNDFLGRSITTGGEIERTLGPRAFVLEGDDLIGDEELLVIGATETGRLTDDQVVLVTGAVRRFNLAEIEREIGADLDDTLFRDYADDPVIVASSVDGTPFTPGPAAAVTIDELTDNGGAYRGRLVTTFGTVDRVLGPQALVIDNSEFFTEDEILVVGADQIPNVAGQPGDAGLNDAPVLVTGTVRPFRLADVERELGIGLDDNLFRDYADEPAILARDITLRPARAGVAPGIAPGLLPIVDLNALASEPNKAALVGREVRLSGVTVQQIAAPNVFWVGPSREQVFLVTLGAQPAPYPNVRQGDTVALDGLVLWTPPAERARQLWNIDPGSQYQNQQIYIQADQIRVVGGR